ncbi:hypothetical protein [Bacillus thuringiensis]|uniref:hypothetical protein n=1 Tax=Bacillus thuringiensis TaxID=1428 RepID=UPI000BF9BBEA|nr:hypothetical protein [Bacillus thuringiensis]PFE87786.1 hypothetical protein CN320_06630 [Bacillus thuringiensis]
MEDYVARFKRENIKQWNNFEKCTEGFTASNLTGFEVKEVLKINSFMANKLEIKLPQPEMVFFVLVYLKGFEYEYQPMEKVLWAVPFKYQGINFNFTVRKFGFRLISETDDESIVKSLIKKINGALKIVDNLMSPVLKEIVNKGDITFSNESALLRERYLYFKEKACTLYNQNECEGETTDKDGYTNYIKKIERNKEAFFYTQAMLDAYFSFQEHLMVLLLPFSDFDKNSESISSFIADTWTLKFTKVFKPSRKPEVMKYFDKLQSIKEQHRNKFAHGGFEKRDGSLLAKVDGIGYIPVSMTQQNHFSLINKNEETFMEICQVIEQFETYLYQDNEWARAMRLIKSGMDILFDDESLSLYKNAIKSDENLEFFFRREAMLAERYADMDW